ncbi:MAG: MBL fold metallo-hydrolase [Syntrophomonadaceae bacterium]|nr:MBL fold metallo-hydrolase [Syntrophomonadaceae bacterium]
MKRLSDNVIVMGNGYFNFYLLGNEDAVLLECGTRAGAAIFKQQWQELEPKPVVKHIVILHSHFDHACGLPILKELFPDAEVLGSAAAQKFLSKEKIVKDLYRNDAIASELYLKHGLIQEKPDTSELGFLGVDRAVGEGDILELASGLSLKFLDAQGHSACSIAAYLESDQVMFVSDATGYRSSKDTISPVFFQDYDLYISTLNKLKSYPSTVLGVAHGDISTGDEIKEFYQSTLQAAEDCYALIKTHLNEGMDENELARLLFDRYIKGGLAYYPEEMMLGSMYLLIKNVKGK